MQHLIVAPIVLPLMTAAVLLLLDKKRRRIRSLLSVGATLASLVVAVALLRRVDVPGAPAVGVYLAGNWEAPFGIVLVADRLSALMLVLASVVGCCVALYADARWARVGVYFQPLLQIQLMGLNGAFLTGDLFNLFVFFEVMLAASYGLQLHGSGLPRVRSGLHYIAVNLLASSLFLIGLAVTYGVMGTLSMADIAGKMVSVPASDRGLLHAGMATIAVAFLIKAAAWPLNAWLVPAYSAASAPVAALFALMTKVGVYVLLRLWTLLFSADAGGSTHFGGPVLVVGGLATIVVGAIGLMSSIYLGRIASFSILVTSGTLLASLGLGEAAVTGAALFYLVSSTLAVSALFLLVEPVERMGAEGKADQAETTSLDEDTNLDDEEEPLVGRAIPVSVALLGMAFVSSSLLVAGLPPLSGFVAKVALLSTVVNAEGARHSNGLGPLTSAWWIIGLVLVSSLFATMSLSRAGIRHFWSGSGQRAPRVKRVEAFSVVALIATGVLLSLFAEPVLRYTAATAEGLYAPRRYVEAVMSTKPRPGPTRLQVDRSVR